MPRRHTLAPIIAIATAILMWLPVALAQKPNTGTTTPKSRRTTSHTPIRPTLPSADRSTPTQVFIEHSDHLTYDEIPGIPPEQQRQILTGNVKLRRAGMTMTCDSAYFFEATNSFDAFGNVKMQQGDTLFVYSDELNYNGIDQLAILFADPGRKVRLINRDVKLETDIFNYDLVLDRGFYNVGGVLTDRQNRLTSVEGEYFPRTKQSYFNYDVRLASYQKNKPLYINTDALAYNTATHVAEISAPSEIINPDGVIYTSSGTYNTSSEIADLYARSTVVTNKGNTITGDTLFYDRHRQYGEAFGNMILTDSAHSSTLYGDYGFYDELRDSAFVTGRALAKEYSRKDTLYIHADTIEAYLDLTDSSRVTNAFHLARIYRRDVQAIADSLSLTERDSILHLYRHPVVWSGTRQVDGNIINVHFTDSTADWARVPQHGFLSEHIAEDCYNQMYADDITTWFTDSTIHRLYGEGSVQIILFPMENDSTYNKFAYVESSYIDGYFTPDNSIDTLRFWPETTAKITPLYLAKSASYFLPKYKWYGDLRPLAPGDVFVIPPEMIELFRTANPINEPQRQLSATALTPNPTAVEPAQKEETLEPDNDLLPPDPDS